jgi:HAD superfamily hydrolase (TIGR01484 family)
MSKQEVIIFDIDGTAVDSPVEKLPSLRLKKAINAKAGSYYFCAATGRPWSFAEPAIRYLELRDPCIISGGTQICEPQTGNILWQCNIEPADAQAVMRILHSYDEYGLVCNDFSEDEYHSGGVRPSEFLLAEVVYLMDFIYLPEGLAREVFDQLKQVKGITCSLSVSHGPGQKDILITNKRATKEHAIAELLRILSVGRRHTTGIGDGHNDVHLFRGVHKKVAMGNAVDELRMAADTIIGDVSEDGLAVFVEGLSTFIAKL